MAKALAKPGDTITAVSTADGGHISHAQMGAVGLRGLDLHTYPWDVDRMEPDIDERWVECNFGDWEGQPISSISIENWEEYKSNLDYQPPNGESINEVNTRVHAALDELSIGENENLLIVTHTLPIKSAFVWVLGVEIPILRTRLSTASYTQIEVARDERTLLNFNITS